MGCMLRFGQKWTPPVPSPDLTHISFREEPSTELFHKIQPIVNLVVNPVVNLIVNTLRKAEDLMPRDIRSS